MKQGQDINTGFPGVFIIHQKIRGNSVDRHIHPGDHELFFPLQGEIQVSAGEAVLKAGPGKMIYLPSEVEHSFRASSSSQGERLIVVVEDKTWKTNGGGEFSPAVVAGSQLCKELLFHLLIYPQSRAAKSLIGVMIQTTSEILEASGLLPGADVLHLKGRISDPRLKKAVSLIQERLREPPPMAELARAAGLSTRTLSRLFLEELGMSPKQAITLYRIEDAKTLLRQGRRTVTDVALEVGYASVSQFITTFRRLTGQLPSHYANADRI